MKNLIFDLDLTLVDSTIAESARKARDWPRVYSLIPQFRLYDGIPIVLDYIRKNEIKTAIVSTAPSSYVRRVVDYFGMPINAIVGYHDALRKPSPDGMIKAAGILGGSITETISFGDRVIDILASNSAGIKSVSCFWGTQEAQALRSTNSIKIYSPIDILSCISY